MGKWSYDAEYIRGEISRVPREVRAHKYTNRSNDAAAERDMANDK